MENFRISQGFVGRNRDGVSGRSSFINDLMTTRVSRRDLGPDAVAGAGSPKRGSWQEVEPGRRFLRIGQRPIPTKPGRGRQMRLLGVAGAENVEDLLARRYEIIRNDAAMAFATRGFPRT